MIFPILAMTVGLWLGPHSATGLEGPSGPQPGPGEVGAPAQETKLQKNRRAKAKAEFPKRKRKVLVESGHRHLNLGVWCRDKGLTSQATMEFLLAVEVSEHKHPGAKKVLGIMRGYGDSFWKKRRKTFPKGLLDQYEKRSKKVVAKNAKERLGLAEWAQGFGLEEGEQEFRALIAQGDGPLEFDKKERIKVSGGTLPVDLSVAIRGEAVQINGRLWMRDEFLSQIPGVESIHEVENERIRVRTMGSPQQAQEVLNACTALLPVLAKDTGGRPKERLNVFLFSKEGAYGDYLSASQLQGFERAKGFAMSGTLTACLDTFGMSDEDVRSLALHEVTHLFVYGITRTRMPDWYSEGFAETYGGQGCHSVAGGKYRFHQVMAEHRLSRLRAGENILPLAELLAGDAIKQRANPDAGLDFYAQSWAFLRFLRTGAGDGAREKLEHWEAVCRGKALGAILDKPTEAGEVQPAQALFAELFQDDMARLETGFAEYVKTL
ncbi:MAG: hypothetical protein P1V35_14205 [Planctomycetota bacterium]|nr:hypothetical protein [Planctomycetota bacterium]